MKPVKEQQYKDIIPQVVAFIEATVGNGGKGKGAPPLDKAIQARFPTIDPADYADIMGEVYSQFMNNRVVDGSAGVNNNPPAPIIKAPKTVKTPLMGDDGKPLTDDKGNPITVDTPVDDSTPAPVDDAVIDPTQTPDYVPVPPVQGGNS
jgi:hypothetical protein